MVSARHTKRARAKNCPSAQLRKQVDEATFALFLENGYENTTMRVISEETGFGAGSLYNTFSGKDDILLDIIMNAYNTVLQDVDELIRSGVDLLVAINIPMCSIIYGSSGNTKYAELLTVAFHNWRIFNAMVDKTIEWEFEYIRKYDEDITREKVRKYFLVIAAVMGRYVIQYKEEGPMDCTEGIVMCMTMFCYFFKIEVDAFDDLISKIIAEFDQQMTLGLFDILSVPRV